MSESKQKEASKELQRRKARNVLIRRGGAEGFLLYVETIFKYHYEKKFNVTWWDPMLAQALMDIFNGETLRLIVEEPPRHGKTERVVRMFASYCQGLDGHIKFQYGTYSGILSILTAVDTKEIMESEIYREIFPRVAFSPKLNLKDHWKLTTGVEFLATSVGGSNTGIGAEIFLGDDLLKAADADSKARRDEAYNFYESSVLTRLEGRKAIILIMQRLHEDDPVGRVIAKGGLAEDGGLWHVISLPVINEKEEVYRYRDMTVVRPAMTPLDESIMNIEEIAQRKLEMSSVEFKRQYMQDAEVSEAGYFIEENYREIVELEIPEQNLFILVDPAESEEKSADDRGLVVVGKSADATQITKTVVMDGRRGKWDVYGTCEQIISLMLKFPAAPVYIEGAGGGISLVKVLRREIMVYNAEAQRENKAQLHNGVFSFKPDNQTSKNQGIKLMANPMEQGYLVFYKFMDSDFKAQLKKELLAFNPERKGNTDNCIDPLSKSFILSECVPKLNLPPKQKRVKRHSKRGNTTTWKGI